MITNLLGAPSWQMYLNDGPDLNEVSQIQTSSTSAQPAPAAGANLQASAPVQGTSSPRNNQARAHARFKHVCLWEELPHQLSVLKAIHRPAVLHRLMSMSAPLMQVSGLALLDLVPSQACILCNILVHEGKPGQCVPLSETLHVQAPAVQAEQVFSRIKSECGDIIRGVVQSSQEEIESCGSQENSLHSSKNSWYRALIASLHQQGQLPQLSNLPDEVNKVLQKKMLGWCQDIHYRQPRKVCLAVSRSDDGRHDLYGHQYSKFSRC